MRAQTLEKRDDAIGFGALAGVLLNGVEKAAVGWSSASIVKEENALTKTPKRCGAKFVWSSVSLGNVVGQSLSHVMNQ